MGICIKPKSGVDFGKLEPNEALYYAVCLQAINDIKESPWKDGVYGACTVQEGLEACDFIADILLKNGYNEKEVAHVFKEIVPNDYKYEKISARLSKWGIEL